MSTLNTSELISSLQSQIIGLQSQVLQQATLNPINTFDGTKKAEFATWAQSIENAARICNLDAIHIALSKLQEAPLKPAIYLEDKETSSDKTLSWTTLKQHLTSNYLKIPYNTHVIKAYDTLQHSRPRDNKEKQCELFRSFQKRFQNKKESINKIAKASDDESSKENWNEFFSEFEKLICEEEGEASD